MGNVQGIARQASVDEVIIRDSERSVSRRDGRGPKIERIANRYGLDGLGDDLVGAWLGDGRAQRSLRELEGGVNKRPIRATFDEAGAHVLDGEAENFYRLLISDDVTAGNHTDVRNTPRERGVDVEQLEADIISYQSVYNYLKRHRNVEYEDDDDDEADVTEAGLTTIRELRSRLRTVTIDVADRLVKVRQIFIGAYEVEVDIRVTCTDCDTRITLTVLLSSGHCDYERERDEQRFGLADTSTSDT